MDLHKLYLMYILSFIIMYFFMYAMVYQYDDIYINLDNFYMAFLMVSGMIIIEIFIMYPNVNVNVNILYLLIVVLFILIRNQISITDTQFLRAMIPHHSNALLMAENIKKKTKNENIKKIADKIISSQTCEINYMKQLLQNRTLEYPC